MGKLILIEGENSSGKSRFAESLVEKLPGKRLYIATMIAATEENVERIQKHRAQRANLGFETLELPYNVGNAEVRGGTVLLEDVSNLYANCIFEKGGSRESVFADIMKLKNNCKILFAVTISGLSSSAYEGETKAYIEGLNSLNASLKKEAAAAVHMELGRPEWIKGEENDIF